MLPISDLFSEVCEKKISTQTHTLSMRERTSWDSLFIITVTFIRPSRSPLSIAEVESIIITSFVIVTLSFTEKDRNVWYLNIYFSYYTSRHWKTYEIYNSPIRSLKFNICACYISTTKLSHSYSVIRGQNIDRYHDQKLRNDHLNLNFCNIRLLILPDQICVHKSQSPSRNL